MASITFANRKLEPVSRQQTWLEAVHRSNMALRTMVPNAFYNSFLEKAVPGGSGYKEIPNEILELRPWYAGTFAVIGDKGKPLGKKVETECGYNKSVKRVHFKAYPYQAALVDTMLLCDHGFGPGLAPRILLCDAWTGKPITTEEGMLEAREVLVKLNGTVHQVRIKERNGGEFQKAGSEWTLKHISESATMGLLSRAHFGCDERRDVHLNFLGSNPLSTLSSLLFAPDTTEAPQAGAAPANLSIKGMTLDELRKLVASAETDLSDISCLVQPEKLEAMRRLLRALDIKG